MEGKLLLIMATWELMEEVTLIVEDMAVNKLKEVAEEGLITSEEAVEEDVVVEVAEEGIRILTSTNCKIRVQLLNHIMLQQTLTQTVQKTKRTTMSNYNRGSRKHKRKFKLLKKLKKLLFGLQVEGATSLQKLRLTRKSRSSKHAKK